MIVTVYELNWKDDRTIRSVMNRNEMHRDIQALFDGDRQEHSNVYRIIERKEKLLLYLYSETPVEHSRAHFGMKYLGEGTVPQVLDNDVLEIDMLVTPIRTIACADGRRRKRPIFSQKERLKWCRRKALENGFEILELAEVKREKLRIDKHDGKPWTLDAYEYKVRARVTDENCFQSCLLHGFGRNGAYGAGMIIMGRQ